MHDAERLKLISESGITPGDVVSLLPITAVKVHGNSGQNDLDALGLTWHGFRYSPATCAVTQLTVPGTHPACLAILPASA